jgi:hypothetical protein
MRIEFTTTTGDGTNVEVLLLEDLGGTEVVADRVWTSDHQGGIWYGEELGVPIRARQLFSWVEESWAKPVIGGKYAEFHPYWQQRREAREWRAAREARDGN